MVYRLDKRYQRIIKDTIPLVNKKNNQLIKERNVKFFKPI